MTDLELCKRIAEIDLECDWELEGGKIALVGTETWLGGNGEPYEKKVVWGYYNPLKDKAVLFGLMVKYEVSPCYESNTCSIIKESDSYDFNPCVGESEFGKKEDLPRAILECIVKTYGEK